MGDMDRRQERVHLETMRHHIDGEVTLARDGYRSRLSDLLNASERDFLVLTNVTVTPVDGVPPTQHPFIAVARRHIVYAVSLPEGPSGPGAQ